MPEQLRDPLWDMHSKLKARRLKVEDVWRDLARFEFPQREFRLGSRSEGEQQSEDIFDSTAMFSNQVLAASLQSGLTNQAIKWFSLRFANDELMEDDDNRLALEGAGLRMLGAFARSNFGTESSEMYLDLGVFGVGAVFVTEQPGDFPIIGGNSFRGLLFEALPVGSYVIAEDSFGRVNTLFHRMLMTPQAAADRWGLDNLSEQLREMVIKGNVEDVAFIHAVGPKNQMPGAKTNLPFASVWFEEKSKHRNAFGGFHEFPFAIVRWSKASGEPYGWGPGSLALNDVKTLNKLIELQLKAMAIAVQPPVKSTINSVIGSIDLSPGGLTIVRNMDDLREIITQANFGASDVKINDLRQSIRREFFVDQLLQLLARETPAMTATEVTAKMQLLREIVGPAFIRLETEFLNPVIDRVFAIMNRAGALPAFPQSIAGEDIEVDYESPIGLAKRGQELAAVDRVVLRAQELGTVGFSEVFDNLKADDILRLTGEIAGAPQSIFFTKEERDQRREQRRTVEQQQAGLQQLLAGSEAARNLAPLAKVAQEAA